jgi:hypothetical protein
MSSNAHSALYNSLVIFQRNLIISERLNGDRRRGNLKEHAHIYIECCTTVQYETHYLANFGPKAFLILRLSGF